MMRFLFYLAIIMPFFIPLQAQLYSAHEAEYELFDIITNDDIVLFESNDVYLIDKRVFLPFNALCQALEFNLKYDPLQHKITGQREKTHLDIALNGSHFDYLIEDEELWLSLDNINTLLESRIDYNFSQLRITLTPLNQLFPIQKRIARSKKSITTLNLNSTQKNEFIIEDKYRLLTAPKGSVRVDLNQNQDKQLDYGLNLQTYSDVLYHSANLNLSRKQGTDLQARLTLTRHKSSPNKPLIGGLNRYQLGDIAVTNTRAGVGYNGVGISFTSLENRYSNYYGKLTLDEFAPANWQAELYSNGYLIQTGTVNSEGKIQFTDVETTYGINRFEIVLYGEYGEEETIVREIMIGNNQLKPGDFNYTGAIIDTAHSLFNDTSIFNTENEQQLAGYIQTEWGLSHSTTLGLSVFQQQQSESDTALENKNNNAEYIVSLTQQLPNALLDLNIKNQGQAGYAADIDLLGSLQYFGLRYQMGASIENEYAGLQQVQNTPLDQKKYRVSLTGKWRKLGYQLSANQTTTKVPVTSVLNSEEQYTQQKHSRINNRLSYRFNRYSFTNTLSYQKNTEVSTVENELALSGRINPNMSIRASSIFDLKNQKSKRFKSANLNFNWQPHPELNNQTRLQYLASNKTTNVSNYLTWRQSQYNLTFATTFDNQDHWNIALGISFNLDWDHHQNRLNISQTYSPASGTLDLFNFIDHNQNAFYDQYDEPLAGVKFAPKKQWATLQSGHNGASYLTGFSPYSPNGLYFDTFDTSASNLRPIYEDFKIYTHPGGIIDLDLPFNYAVEVLGELTFDLPDNHFQPQFIPLELSQNNKLIATTLSEFDNSYFFERIWPGTYEIEIAADYLQTKNLQATPNKLTVIVTAEQEVITLTPFVLTPQKALQPSVQKTAPQPQEPPHAKALAEQKEHDTLTSQNQLQLNKHTHNKHPVHKTKPSLKPNVYAIQAAAYRDPVLCQARLIVIQQQYPHAFLLRDQQYCRIYTHQYSELSQAKLEHPKAFIVKLKQQQISQLTPKPVSP